MSVPLISSILLIWVAYVIEINGSVIAGISFAGTTGLLFWTGAVCLILAVVLGITAGIKERQLQEFNKFKTGGII